MTYTTQGITRVIRRALARLDREGSFVRAYESLLEEMTSSGPLGPTNPAPGLDAKRAERRHLPPTPQLVRVAGFGTNDDWRRNGLWRAIKRTTDFSLFEVPDGPYPGANSEFHERQLKEDGFLRFIDAWEKTGQVHVAFFSHSGRHISDRLLERLHARRIWTVIMSVDDKHQFLQPCDEHNVPHQIRVARKADLYWSNWPLIGGFLERQGGTVWFTPPGADLDRYYTIDCPRDLDVVFVGARYGVRSKLVATLQRHFDVRTFGYGWPGGAIPFEETIRLFNRAKIVLGIGGVGPTLRVQTLKGRDFEVPSCGVPYLTSANSELAPHFVIGEEIVCYSSPEDCVEVVGHLLSRPDLIESLGAAARVRCAKDHTWDKRILDLVALLREQ